MKRPRWSIMLGRRVLLLLLLGCIDLVYGSALLVANAAGETNRWWVAARWWPAAQGELLGVDIGVWGVVWVGIGALLVSSPLWREDRHLFASEMLLKTIWGAGAIVWAFDTASPGIWGPAATYVGMSLIVLLAAGWTDIPMLSPLLSNRLHAQLAERETRVHQLENTLTAHGLAIPPPISLASPDEEERV